MDQTFNKFFSWVDIHGIYYIVETDNQIWWFCFLENIPFLTRMTQNWTEKITRTIKMTEIFKKYTKNIINGYVYREKKS